MTFSRRENVWGVDWVHLVWVGVGIKKARGGSWVWKYAFSIQLEPLGVKEKGSEIG